MDDDKGYVMYCNRCGAEMNSNSRYCMKCGNLNYNHEANKNMRPYIQDNNKTTYQVSNEGKFMVNDNPSVNANPVIGGSVISTNIASNTGNSMVCFLLNFFVYLIVLGFSFYSYVDISNITLEGVASSTFPFILIITSISFIYMYSLELIYMKCNKPWWGVLIPIYNVMLLSEIVFNKKWIGLLTFIPIIGEVVLLVMIYKLGNSFKYNGLLVVLLSIIFIPMMGFGSHFYQDKVFADRNKKNSIEKDYKYRKTFLAFSLLFLLLGAGLFAFSNMSSIEKGGEIAGNYYYVYASKRMVSKARKFVDKGQLKCENSEYSSTNGVYYLYYADIGDFIYLPLYYQRDEISGYIKIDNTSGSSKYYVSLSDGKYGFSDTLVDDINKDTVVRYSKLKKLDDNYDNICVKRVEE